MTPLEQYLNNATRGIWGKRKLEIREEIEADITERSKKFLLDGFSRDQALAKTFEELGSPQQLSTGFWEVQMAMQKNFMFGAVMLFSVVTWQATLQRNFNYSCVSPNKLVQLETQVSSSFLNQFSMARNLENLDFTIFTAKNIKTTVTQGQQKVVTHL